jgi:hypothetical protein
MSTIDLKEIARPIARYAAKHGPKSMQRWLPMSDLRKAVSPILIERGEISDTLVIAFTGGAHWINIPLFEFLETTQILKYNRILLKDKYRMFYHYGVDWRRRDWPRLLKFLDVQIQELRPKRLFCIGSSSGGYAALIAGHYLNADYIHAFGPQTILRLDEEGIREALLPKHRRRLAASKRTFREVLDLVPLLKSGEGKSQIFVHYCNGHLQDRAFAERVAELPRVTTFGYPCDVHEVAISLAKQRFLGELLQVANQEKLAELAREHFGMKIKITWAATSSSNDSARVSPDMSGLSLSLT